MHFEEGNRAAIVSPDLMVVFGASPHHRMSYKLWEEPKVPDLVAEVLSEKTWRRDLTVKSALYQERIMGTRGAAPGGA
ncbi:MAG: Uma2 family endonuclease [Gammaproteobacteria bacterium]|nr:Uma2 family endonuclease [Gammaproteobacteria bacterium]